MNDVYSNLPNCYRFHNTANPQVPHPKKPNGDRRFAKENKSGQYRRLGDSMPAVDSTRRIIELESGIQRLGSILDETSSRILKLESRRPRFGWRR